MISGRLLIPPALALLSGCPLGDKFPYYRADISTIENKLCISIAPEGDEKISSLSIYDTTSNKILMEKYELSLYAAPGKCIPNYGFNFETGKDYHYSIIVKSEKKKREGKYPYGRSYSASFTLRNNNGALEFTTNQWCDNAPKGNSSSWRKECLATK